MNRILPNPKTSGVSTARTQSDLADAARANEVIGAGHRTTRGIILPRHRVSVPRFSGIVYLRGKKHSGLNVDHTKLWVRVRVSPEDASEQAGPPPDQFPDTEEWYYKPNTFGDIHVTRFG